MPNDIVIACCRDEEDIIGSFIDFYLDAGFDRLCLIDNGSIDRSVEIIQSHPCQDRIVLHEDSRIGYDIRLREYFDLFRMPTDRWVFFIDVDEFIYFREGAKRFFAELGDQVNCLQLRIKDIYHDVENQSFFSHPLLSAFQEVLFHDTVKEVCKSGSVDRICCGKHRIDFVRKHVYCPQDVYIRHYSFRSPMQVMRKIRNRLETDQSLTEEQRVHYSAYDKGTWERWIEETCLMIQGEYWSSFMKAQPEYELDDTIRTWYLGHLQRAAFQFPVPAR